jgi:hypothetical protein
MEVFDADEAVRPPRPRHAARDDDDDWDRPRRRSRRFEDDDDDDDRRPRPQRAQRSSGGPSAAWVVVAVCGVGLLLFLGCIGACFMLPWKFTPNPGGGPQPDGNPPPIVQGNPPTPNPNPGPVGGGKPPVEPKERVVEIAPRDLAQVLFDNEKGTFERYINCALQLEGVVREQSKGPDGSTITEVVFRELVTDKKIKDAKEYRIWCRLSKPVPVASRVATGLAVGKTVTVRGHLTGSGGDWDPQATLNDCTVVRSVPDTKPDGGPDKPPPLVAWVVKPDPAPKDLAPPEKVEGTIPITSYAPQANNLVDEVVFPTSPSPFVSVGAKGSVFDAHDIWDLRTMKKVGTVKPDDPFTRAWLSPDGAYWAKSVFMLKAAPGADVYAVADGKHYRVTIAEGNGGWIDDFDFAGPGQLMSFSPVNGKGGIDLVMKIWDIKKGSLVSTTGAPAHYDPKLRAFSPGRRFIALMSREYDRVMLYDLQGGHRAGELPLPAGAKCLGLSFSPDGKQLAGLFTVGNTTRILAWNMDDGASRVHLNLAADAVTKVEPYQGPVLDWLPEGGWLLYGRNLIDPQSGAAYWRIRSEYRAWSPCHVYPGNRLAFIKPGKDDRTLVIEPLPADKLAEALKAARGGK